MNKMSRILVLISAAGLVMLAIFLVFSVSARARAARSPETPGVEISVTTNKDEAINDGSCSLREAVLAANSNAAVDTCPAGSALFTDTISFNTTGFIIFSKPITVTAGGNLVVDGANAINLSGDHKTRLFFIQEDADLDLERIAIQHGYADFGGGIYNQGTLVISATTISGNQAIGAYFTPGGKGGGIYSTGVMTVTNSGITDNIATSGGGALGGGIYSEGMVWIKNSGISINTAGDYGGGIVNSSPNSKMNIDSSALLYNTSGLWGGAIYNSGTMTITQSSIGNNQSNHGGGIFNYANDSSLLIISSLINDNSALTGGGIENMDVLTIIESIIGKNYASNGGGIDNDGYTTIISSTLTRNSAHDGGGIWNMGEVDILDSTLESNRVLDLGRGAAIMNNNTVYVINSTISGNKANTHLSGGGGIYNANGYAAILYSTLWYNPADLGGGSIYNDIGYGTVLLSNSIVAGNPGVNCSGAITDGGYNIEDSSSCKFAAANGSMSNTNPLLSGLRDNGGPTWTHALIGISPAIDAGDDAQCLPFDQRGVSRPRDGDGDGIARCDIGAFELEKPALIQYLPTVIKSP